MNEEIEQSTLEAYSKTISQIDERIAVLRKCWHEVGTEKESAILMFRSTIEEKRAVIEREEADWLRTRSKVLSDFNRAMALIPATPMKIRLTMTTKTTLTVSQIRELAIFAGFITRDAESPYENDEEADIYFYEDPQEITDEDDGAVSLHKVFVYFPEAPEEGGWPLDYPIKAGA